MNILFSILNHFHSTLPNGRVESTSWNSVCGSVRHHFTISNIGPSNHPRIMSDPTYYTSLEWGVHQRRTLRYFWVLWGILGYFEILLGTLRHFWVLWGTFGYSEVLWGTLGYFEILLGTLRYFWVLWGTFGYFEVLFGTSKFSIDMGPVTSWSSVFPIYSEFLLMIGFSGFLNLWMIPSETNSLL